MAPNVFRDLDLLTCSESKRRLRYGSDASDETLQDTQQLVKDFVIEEDTVEQPVTTDTIGANQLWKNIFDRKTDDGRHNKSDLNAALSSIRILEDPDKNQEWLQQFNGRLSKVPMTLVEGLRYV